MFPYALLTLFDHVVYGPPILPGTTKAVKVTRPSTSPVGPASRACLKVRKRDAAGGDKEDASPMVRRLIAEPDSKEVCELSYSGRFRRNSVHA